MLLAETAAVVEQTSRFSGFDIFVILFSIVLVFAFIRLVTAKERNLFAIGFTFISMACFLFLDFLVVQTWLGNLSM